MTCLGAGFRISVGLLLFRYNLRNQSYFLTTYIATLLQSFTIHRYKHLRKNQPIGTCMHVIRGSLKTIEMIIYAHCGVTGIIKIITKHVCAFVKLYHFKLSTEGTKERSAIL